MSSVTSNYLCKTCGFSSGDRKVVARHVRAVHEIGGVGGEGRGRERRQVRHSEGKFKYRTCPRILCKCFQMLNIEIRLERILGY